MAVAAPLLLLALTAAARSVAAAGMWEWRDGRATNYGGYGDPWNIHSGVGSRGGERAGSAGPLCTRARRAPSFG
jgi:hypothetical protein